VPWHFGLHAAPNGAGMCGVMPSYKHIAPPEQRPGVTRQTFRAKPLGSKAELRLCLCFAITMGFKRGVDRPSLRDR
jgi:hypothetical protein